MINVFIIANGSNDLYYSVSNNIDELYSKLGLYKDLNIYLFCKIEKCDELNLWNKIENSNSEINGILALKYYNGKKIRINTKNFFRKVQVNNKMVDIMAPDLFLQKYINKNEINVVIINGHGGPFQSLLDMSISPSMSISTVLLCKRIKKFKIDLLFLDMCAMNYLEIMYELLNESKISNIITYKNFAPFLGINYNEYLIKLINVLENKLNLQSYQDVKDAPLIFINKGKLKELKQLKAIQSDLVKIMLREKEPIFDKAIDEFKNILSGLVEENQSAKEIRGNGLNYLKYYLNDSTERKLYNRFQYVQNNLWSFIVTKEIVNNSNFNPEYIILEKSSLENIIYLHNRSLNQENIDLKVNEFIKNRKEEEFYNH